MHPFVVTRPTSTPAPVVASLPHSGTFVPPAIAAGMRPDHLASLPNTDWHLDRRYAFLPELGVTVLQATHSRYVIDLNRSLDPPLLDPFTTSAVAERTAFDQPVYLRPPTAADIDERIDWYYRPYHQQLSELLRQTVDRFGRAYLLDLHSFFGPTTIDCEIDLGNRRGDTCGADTIACFEAASRAAGYEVRQNRHYTGGYIVRTYGGWPQVEALQIEVRYHLYLAHEQLDRSEPPRSDVPQLRAASERLEGVFRSAIDGVGHPAPHSVRRRDAGAGDAKDFAR